jgi:hypothetical protein
MAIIATEGFDKYSNVTNTDTGLANRFVLIGNVSASISIAAGHFGYGFCLRFNNPTSTAADYRLALASSISNIGGGFTLLCDDVSGDWGAAGVGEPLIDWKDSAGNSQCILNMDLTGNFVLRRGATTIAQSTGGPHITSNVVVFVEYELVVDDTAGSFKLWVNSNLIINATGLDTKNTAVAGVQNFCFVITNSLDSIASFDNLIITDGARPGPNRRIVTLSPTSDTADKDFVASTGTDNFAVLDESPLNITDYVSGSVVGDKDLYGFEDLPVGFGSVDAVCVVAVASKSDVVVRELRSVLKSGATETAGPALTLLSNYRQARLVATVNPDGNVAWSPGAVNAITAGQEVVT